MYENRRFLPDQPIRLAFLRRDFFPSPVNGISVSIEMDLDESVEKPFYDVRFFPRRCIFRPRSELRDRCFLLSFSFLYPKQSEVLSPLLDARRCSPKKRSRDSGLTIGITQRGHFFPSPSLLPPSVVITQMFFTRVSLENRTIVKRRLDCRLIPLRNIFTPVHKTYKTSREFNHYIHQGKDFHGF